MGAMIPALLLIWPSALVNGDIGKQLAAGSLVCIMFVTLFINPILLKKDLIGLVFAIFFIYLVLNLLINPLTHGNGSFHDFVELVRITGCITALFLGFSFGLSHLKPIHIYIILTFLLIIELGFVLDIFSFPFNLYSTRTARFSGLAIGVNYVFTTVLFLMVILVYQRSLISKYLYSYSILVLIVAIGLSGSRTSMIITAMAILLYNMDKFMNLFKVRNLFILILIFVGWDYLGNIESIRRIMKMIDVLLTLQFTLEDFPTLLKRFLMWEQYMPLLLDRVYLGYGGAKDVLRIIDNSYLMTVLRYGLVGILLESIIYIIMLLSCFKVRHGTVLATFIMCYLVSGITTSFMYELRAPYILFYVFGVIWKDVNEQSR